MCIMRTDFQMEKELIMKEKESVQKELGVIIDHEEDGGFGQDRAS